MTNPNSAIITADAGARAGKVLFVYDPVLGHATAHVRGFIYRDPLTCAGWTVEFINYRPLGFPDTPLGRAVKEDALVERARGFDLVYLLKVSSLRLVRRLKRHTNARIIFDLTDALWKPFHQQAGWQDLDAILRECDAVFSENEYICAYGRRHNPRVFSIPACTQIERFDAMRRQAPPRSDGRIVIGWVGSPGTVSALESVREALDCVSARHPAVLLRVLGCEDPARLPAFRTTRVSVLPHYNEETMIAEILKLDIGLFPPPLDAEDYRTRGALKAMLYMSGGVPAVAQNDGECRRLIQDGVNGMLADTAADWANKLETLIQSAGLRQEMGRRELAAIRVEHSLDHVSGKLDEALREVLRLPVRRGWLHRLQSRPPICRAIAIPRAASSSPAAVLRGRRVLFLFGNLELGGSERQAVLLARRLKEQGAEVRVWGLSGGRGRAAELCEEAGVPWRVVPAGWPAQRTRRIRPLIRFARALRAERPDILMPYTALPNVLCGLTWRWTGARLCVWNQRDLGVGSEGIGPRSQRAAVRRVRLVIANSQAGAEYLIRELGVPEGRIRVIRNGIELDPRAAGRDAWRRSLGVEAGCFLAVMVANLQPAKDHVTLLRAWRILLDRLPAGRREAVLLLAGYSGPTADRIKALAFDLDLGRRVRFLGPVKDVAGLLGAADLGVLSSRSEGCPNGVLECMAAGLPVVGTDIPGIREALGPDAARLLAPAGDAEGLAQRIQLFAGDPGLRAQAGEANRRRAQAEFSLQRMCEETTALLWEALVP